jgi:hypothetical protein
MLPDNYRAINLTRKMGFELKYMEDGTVKGILNLKEEESPPCQETKSLQEMKGVALNSEARETETVSG